MSKRHRIGSVLIALVMILSGAMTMHPSSAVAQSGALWAKTYGGSSDDQAKHVQQTSDSGYIVAGYTKSFGAGDADIWILKLASNGSVEWQKTYGGSTLDKATCVQQTSDGGYIVAGWTESFGAGSADIWLLKLSSNGDVEWQKTYGGSGTEVAFSIQQTTDGGYIVAGYTASFGAGDDDLWILKLASNGSVEWQKTYGGDAGDRAGRVKQTSDGGYIVTGSTYSFSVGAQDFWVIKLTSDGNVEWQKSCGGIKTDSAGCFEQTSDGGYIVAGTTAFGAGEEDLWILKLTSNGDIEWQKAYGGSNRDLPYSFQQTSDGGYTVAGTTDSFGAGGNDFWVLKLSSNGNAEWQKTYGGINSEWALCSEQTSDEGYIVAGSSDSFGAGEEDIWILKLDEDGNIPECSLGVESGITITNTQSTFGDTTSAISDTVASVSMPSYLLKDSSCSTDTQCSYSPTTPAVDEPSATDGFASIAPFLETAYGYRMGEGTEGWTVYNPLWPTQLNTLTTLYVARGYWVYVGEVCILQFGSSVYALDAGWNLIGWIPQQQA
ncbi:hypothetical protein ACFLWZ_02525 [Chloroflexota bacterium]